MFDKKYETINNIPSTNEHDIEVEKIKLEELQIQLQLDEKKKERIELIMKNVDVYTELCTKAFREGDGCSGNKLLPVNGSMSITFCGETITFTRAVLRTY